MTIFVTFDILVSFCSAFLILSIEACTLNVFLLFWELLRFRLSPRFELTLGASILLIQILFLNFLNCEIGISKHQISYHTNNWEPRLSQITWRILNTDLQRNEYYLYRNTKSLDYQVEIFRLNNGFDFGFTNKQRNLKLSWQRAQYKLRMLLKSLISLNSSILTHFSI